MSAGAVIMMLLVCTITFGGFVVIMAYALSRERQRRKSPAVRPDRPQP